MNEIKTDIKEEPERRIEPISKPMTLWSGAIVLFVLIVTFVALVIIPSPDGDDETFLKFLLRNMNLVS